MSEILLGKYIAASFTLADNDMHELLLDVNGALIVNPGALSSATDSVTVVAGTGATGLGKAVDSVAGATDVGVASLAVRDDALTTLTPIDGDYTHLRTNSVGALWTTVNGTVAVTDNSGSLTVDVSSVTRFSVDFSAALEPSSLSKATGGTVHKFGGRIDSTAASGTYYVQLIDATSVPGDGAVTLLTAPIKIVHTTGTDSPFDVDCTGNDQNSGIAAGNGIVWCISTTEFTKTVAGSIASATMLYS